jgi:putative membrane protein
MRKSESINLFIPQRQSKIAVVLILYRFIKLLIRQLWPLLLIIFLNPKEKIQILIGGAVIVISTVTLLMSLLSYFKFYFYISDDKLNIEKGILRTTKLNLPFDRIQTINFEQNILHQIFNVVSLKIDTAGTKGSEISFDALDKERAHRIRDYILSQKAEQQSLDQQAQVIREIHDELILRLTPIDLLKIGISQNHLRTAGLILVFFYGIIENIDNAVSSDFFGQVNEKIASLVSNSFFLVLIAIPVFLFISFIITLFRTVVNYYDLHFWKTTNGFKLISGLFNRKEKSAQKNKIQLISWSTNPIKKLFRIFSLRLYQASSTDVLGEKSIMVPGCYLGQINHTIEKVMPGAVHARYEKHRVHVLAAIRMFLFAGLLPCAIMSAIALIFKNYQMFWIWLWLPVTVWLAILYYKKRSFELYPEFLRSNGGIIATTHKLIENYKIQSVSVSQTFVQIKRDLANIHIYTASGEIKIGYIPLEKALALKDYLLYSVESSTKAWM